VDAEEHQQRDHDDADHTAADHERQLVLADAERALVATARTARTTAQVAGLPRRLPLLLPPALLWLLGTLAPRLLLVLLRLLSPPLRRLTRLTTLAGLRPPTTLRRLTLLAALARLRTPATLLRLTVRRLAVGRLSLWRVALVRGLALLWRALAPSAALRRGLLPPARLLLAAVWRLLVALLRRLAAVLAALPVLSPVLPAWLAPRLPRTPWPLRRRRHICSF
jgi:hypothetical protein